MKTLKIILISIIISVFNFLYSQIKIDDNCRLLNVSEDKKYIVYFKLSSDKPGEYLEGNVFVYDILKSKTQSIVIDNRILNFTQTYWVDNFFYIGDGQIVERFNFSNKKRDTLFIAGNREIINAFSPSPDNKKILLSIKKTDTIKTYQEIRILNAVNNQTVVIANNLDMFFGEDIRPDFNWSPNSDRLFIRDIENKLYGFSLTTKLFNIIDTNVVRLYHTDNTYCYYTKVFNDTLFLFRGDRASRNQFEILNVPNGEIDFVKSENIQQKPNILIGVNDNIILYNPKGIVKRLDIPSTGKYVYACNKYAIQQKDKNLYFYKIKLK